MYCLTGYNYITAIIIITYYIGFSFRVRSFNFTVEGTVCLVSSIFINIIGIVHKQAGSVQMIEIAIPTH